MYSKSRIPLQWSLKVLPISTSDPRPASIVMENLLWPKELFQIDRRRRI